MSDNDRKGILLAFEGIDGSGKSTQIRMLKDYLERLNLTVACSAEPTSKPYGRKIRDALSSGKRLSPEDELMFFKLDRSQHVDELIKPRLQRGDIILIDRYYYSSMAYQGSLGIWSPEEIHKMMIEFAPVPDITFMFELSLDTAIERITVTRGSILDPLEKRENLARVKAVFDSLALPEIYKINAEQPSETVFTVIKSAVNKILQEKQLLV